eukprot:CAMPEP_0185027474 /NCGR_PEP_ID=MMETSP1103-20130426/12563_1 /TAXON_ID=36769 /ORGANISM="Paraphysomonas bandaiensis, Strain Caron Lab Isolate" /LENGTH=295 /DNA_ID=CAMNT_0027561487 /DNA_START=57 /DNA_END=944 /DNA_ORIENTATION=+
MYSEWCPPQRIDSLYTATDGNKFQGLNSPHAGARSTAELPTGSAPIQYYSIATPNGMKPSILLEELQADYDAHKISLRGSQFDSGFVAVNPNSKIPAAIDRDGPGGQEVRLFESGSIMLYFADKFKRFVPSQEQGANRAEVMNWLFWQMAGQGPMTGNFGHFFVYAPAEAVEARNYGVARYGMEVKRLCSVLDMHLSENGGRMYMVGNEYSIADMAIFPWFNQLRTGYIHPSGVAAAKFLSIEESYPRVVEWADRIWERPAVKRGMDVCRFDSDHPKPWLANASGGQRDVAVEKN